MHGFEKDRNDLVDKLDAQSKSDATDDDYNQTLNALLDVDKKISGERLRFLTELKEVLSSKQIAAVYCVRAEFCARITAGCSRCSARSDKRPLKGKSRSNSKKSEVPIRASLFFFLQGCAGKRREALGDQFGSGDLLKNKVIARSGATKDIHVFVNRDFSGKKRLTMTDNSKDTTTVISFG